MEASGYDQVGCQLSDAGRRRAAIARVLRMGVSDGGKSSSSEMAAVSELETELALLREENARLKVERHRPADAGHVIERMRSIRQQAPEGQPDCEPSRPAEGVQALTDCLMLREGLMDACQEAQQAMQGIRGRLEALTGDIHSRAGERATPESLAASVVQARDARVDDSDEDSSELAQSVA
jgi:hypothetical protein